VQPLLDAVVDYLPSPLDVPPIKGIDGKATRSCAIRPTPSHWRWLAFKIMDDPFVGTITFCASIPAASRAAAGVIKLHEGPQGAASAACF